MPAPTRPRRFLLLTLAACLASAAGCALDGWPRIDPSGEQILIFPGETPPVAPGQPVIAEPPPAVVDPFTGVAPIEPPAGNLVAPPVYEDESQGCFDRLINGPRLVGEPVAVAPAGQHVIVGPAQPQDRVTLTPERILAPIGSEVVLRAGLVQSSGYLLCNERVDWALGQQGVGQFVDICDESQADLLRWPWQLPRKIDNNYAIGYTTPFDATLPRNLSDPADDVRILRGEAWVSVTSAHEGTSYITAYAPGVKDWAVRKASSVIYWVDAQWSLPPSTTVPAGQPHTLTTTITRQSDGSPIAGWVVQYEVLGQDGARLGYEAGQTAEAVTDGQGRASVEISPEGAGAGTSTVNITIVRPDNVGNASGPRINVGTGQATVTWALDAPSTGLPPIDATPAPAQPPIFEQPIDPGAGPISPQPTGQPNLVVQLRRDTADPVRVGDTVSFTILVRNDGDGYARNIEITDEFDRGLTNSLDSRGLNKIVYDGMSDLAPGESDQVQVEFDVLEAGQRVQAVTVTADGAREAYDRAVFTAQPIQQDPPNLRVSMVSPLRWTVGDVSRVEGQNSDIRAVIENVGTTTATNVSVRIRHDGALHMLSVEKALAGETLLEDSDGQGYQWTLASLPPGQRRVLRVQSEFLQPSTRSCIQLFVSAAGGAERADEACFEVLARIGDSPAEGGGGPGPGAPSGLSLSMASIANPAQAGRSSALQLFVVNNGQRVETQVTVELLLPNAITPNLTTAQPPTAQLVQGGVIRFAPIPQLAPGARESILIPYDAVTQGRYNLQARVLSAETPQGVPAQVSLEINPR